jgi:2-phosphoglycerate kinase
MAQPISAISIMGSSHVGKTTLASLLSDRLGWNIISTDRLARHPGRPWPTAHPAIAEYYANLSSETIYWFLRIHHENMWPGVKQKIEAEVLAGKPFVIEGSAWRPEYIARLDSVEMAAVCLYAEADFLRDRIRSKAQYNEADQFQRLLIDKFIARSLRDNAEMRVTAQKLGVPIVDVADTTSIDDLFKILVERALPA